MSSPGNIESIASSLAPTEVLSHNTPEQHLRAVLESCPTELRDILETACTGAELSFDQAMSLVKVQSRALAALVSVADALRKATVGDTITYVVNRNINFTNVC